MIEVGVPEQTVEDVMILDGFSDADIDLFFINIHGQDRLSDAGSTRSRASSYIIDFEKYETMLRLGISEDAIIVEMERDGFSPEDIDDFFEGPVPPPLPPLPPAGYDRGYYDGEEDYYDDPYDDEYDDYPYDDEYDDGYDYDMPEIDPRYPPKYARDDESSRAGSRPTRGDPPLSGRSDFKDSGRGGVGRAAVKQSSSQRPEGGHGKAASASVYAKPVTSTKLVRAVPARSRPVIKLNLPPPRRKGDVKTNAKLDEKNTLHFKKMIEVRRFF